MNLVHLAVSIAAVRSVILLVLGLLRKETEVLKHNVLGSNAKAKAIIERANGKMA